jgi:hypothetical protein
MYRDPANVECATCGQLVERSRTDIVDFGTGYCCLHCSTTAQVVGHLVEARRQEQQRDSDELMTDAPGATVEEVGAEVLRNLLRKPH